MDTICAINVGGMSRNRHLNHCLELPITRHVSSQSYAVQRKDERLPLPIPIVVTGVGKDGSRFSEPTQTVNVSLQGMGLFLKHDLHPNSQLNILICHRQNLFRVTAEVCHVTEREGNKIVGVKLHRPMELSTS